LRGVEWRLLYFIANENGGFMADAMPKLDKNVLIVSSIEDILEDLNHLPDYP
jgi:hypothetical protein